MNTKYYLAKFTVIDGEHEHNAQFTIKMGSTKALTMPSNVDMFNKAWKLAEEQEHNTENYGKGKYFDYGDGTTAAQLKNVVEITREEAETLHELGVSFYL